MFEYSLNKTQLHSQQLIWTQECSWSDVNMITEFHIWKEQLNLITSVSIAYLSMRPVIEYVLSDNLTIWWTSVLISVLSNWHALYWYNFLFTLILDFSGSGRFSTLFPYFIQSCTERVATPWKKKERITQWRALTNEVAHLRYPVG